MLAARLSAMRFTVEPSPAGGYHVRVAGSDAPLSHHDTEEEAEARRLAYERGAADPAQGERVDLPDGSEVIIRPLRPQDKPLFVAAALTARGLELFTDLDHSNHEALGAFEPRTGAGLGVARYLRNAERPHSAEAAVAVIDSWHGRGLGGVLLRRLCARALADGIETFTASLLTENRSMLHLFGRLGAVHTRTVENGVIEIDVELPVGEAATLLRSAATGHVGHLGSGR
jgi:GNAT superfamily N-acetyltransferase